MTRLYLILREYWRRLVRGYRRAKRAWKARRVSKVQPRDLTHEELFVQQCTEREYRRPYCVTVYGNNINGEGRTWKVFFDTYVEATEYAESFRSSVPYLLDKESNRPPNVQIVRNGVPYSELYWDDVAMVYTWVDLV